MPFDSGIFGIPMAQLAFERMDRGNADQRDLDDLITTIMRNGTASGLAHLSCQLPAEAVGLRRQLERRGFALMDISVQYRWDLSGAEVVESRQTWRLRVGQAAPLRIPKLGVVYRRGLNDDLPALQHLARQVFTTETRSRYANDPSLPLAATAEFYGQWVKNAIDGTFGRCTVAALPDGAPIGFQCFRRESADPHAGWMGIGAVDRAWRGRGVFAALLAHIFRWCQERGVTVARGRTLLDNDRMHAACRASGAIEEGIFHSFHLSLPRARPNG